MIKIFDCSNSSDRPIHRGGGGPVVNDVMRYLQENAEAYGCKFVTNTNNADVVITNDVFPKSVLASGKPLVKRMDGVFWHTSTVSRNRPLNDAAMCADKVIFISDYSRKSYFSIYGAPLKDYCVIRHWVDPKVFKNTNKRLNKKFTFAASATDWKRPEKRYYDILRFASIFKDQAHILLIGKTDPFIHVNKNITTLGYIQNPQDMADVFNMSDGFLNLSYRDAATKTVPQAINCGLPVLYANSGGVPEMVGDYGVGIEEFNDFNILDSVPQLSTFQLEKGFMKYLSNFDKIKKDLKEFDSVGKFNRMLARYFTAIKSVLTS